ncbi:hypothetical protein OTB20_07515 [Streptomyces sp. H27-H1]|uniref:hypothetical protein n=1 Tax=Streptomyces sp. H27-H1 TaxID=2996461 RepID=UPI0022721D8E|nr:hypothetical protein [Streptomyces sp. H27-H1]MCY0926058.1 hypothetical protein [Streptomyces sp. H27-H1]
MSTYGFPSSHPSPHHRQPRTRRHPNAPAAVVTTAALSSLGLLLPHQAAAAPAAPRPSVEEVRTRVDELHRQAQVEGYFSKRDGYDGNVVVFARPTAVRG